MAEYRSILPLEIGKTLIVAVTGTAQDVAINGKAFMIQNLDSSNAVYFKEKTSDNVVCTTSNGIALATNTLFPFQLVAGTLSIIGAGNASVGITFLS